MKIKEKIGIKKEKTVSKDGNNIRKREKCLKSKINNNSKSKINLINKNHCWMALKYTKPQ